VGSGVVGVLIAGLDPFYLPLIRGIEEAAGRAGLLALVADTQDSAERAAELTRRLAVRGIDGLIEVSVGAQSPNGSSRSRASPRASIPTVYVDQPDRGGHSFVFDAARGADEATRHLLDHGHRRVAIIAPRASRPNVRGLVDGWQAALRARGVRPAPEDIVEVAGFTIEDGRAGLARLLDGPRPPGAVFAAAARLALGALVEARRRGLSVPGDIALAGYTDIESAQLVDPPLTMVAVPAHEAGLRAMETLRDLIAGRRVAPRRHVLGVELVVRGSCGRH
jgi:DNA-binding LacI/PurR family transcriptional regulator